MNNTFEVNEALNNGGAVYLQSGYHTFTANTLVSNTANWGAAVYSNADSLACINNVIANNLANVLGGGLFLVNGEAKLINNTLTGNRAIQEGGGIYAQTGEHQFDNNIFWNNQIGTNPNLPGSDYHNIASIMMFNHNILQFGIGAYNPADLGIDNIFGQNPLFIDPVNIIGPDNINRTNDDGLHLQSGSPAINAGNNALLPSGITTDITGALRVQMATIDMGAYEKENIVVCLVFAGIQTNTNSNCTATSMELTATGGDTYLWEDGSTNNPRTVSASGIYSVTVTTGNGCTASESIQVIVSQLPQLVVNINGTSNACEGSFINLQANANMTANYEWSGPNGFSFNGPYFTISIATAAMSGLYTVTATNADGCTKTASRMVNVSATSPTLSGTTQICAGSAISLTAFGGNSYTWGGPNGFTTSGSNMVRYNATVAMSGTYTVTVSGAASCTGTASVQVAVHPKPAAALSGATSVCSGGTIELSAPLGGISYIWSGPNGFTTNTGANNILTRNMANTTMSGMYKVTVTSTGGCTATSSRLVSVSAPTPASVTGATSVCANSTLSLTCTSAGVNYQWSGPGGFIFTGAAMTRAPAVAGTYIVTVTNASGCISTSSRNVTVNSVSVPSIMNNSNCGRIWLIASGGNSHQWSGPNGYTFTGSTINRNPATSAMFGIYTVTVTGSGGCTASASITISCTAGKTMEEEEAFLLSNATLFAYPNPVKGATTINFQTNMAEEVQLSLHDLNGCEVAHLYSGRTDAGISNQITTDIGHLPAGTYLIILRRSTGISLTLRLIVQ